MHSFSQIKIFFCPKSSLGLGPGWMKPEVEIWLNLVNQQKHS